ncbi:hypothetical protein V7P28_29945, partial [Klebsiella michiganensis]
MHVAAVKLPVQGARAAVDQCLKIGVVIQRACDTLLAEMVEQAARGEVADTRFGCSPFARITLI